MEYLTTFLIAFLTALATGIITFIMQERKLRKDFETAVLDVKTEFMAENAARHFLMHKGYTDRKFETLKKYLGGWDKQQDELRRILVRAGAIRTFEGKTEWWTLLDRLPEKIEKLKKKSNS